MHYNQCELQSKKDRKCLVQTWFWLYICKQTQGNLLIKSLWFSFPPYWQLFLLSVWIFKGKGFFADIIKLEEEKTHKVRRKDTLKGFQLIAFDEIMLCFTASLLISFTISKTHYASNIPLISRTYISIHQIYQHYLRK